MWQTRNVQVFYSVGSCDEALICSWCLRHLYGASRSWTLLKGGTEPETERNQKRNGSRNDHAHFVIVLLYLIFGINFAILLIIIILIVYRLSVHSQ